MTGYNLQT